jgi:hypothetical protein
MISDPWVARLGAALPVRKLRHDPNIEEVHPMKRVLAALPEPSLWRS